MNSVQSNNNLSFKANLVVAPKIQKKIENILGKDIDLKKVEDVFEKSTSDVKGKFFLKFDECLYLTRDKLREGGIPFNLDKVTDSESLGNKLARYYRFDLADNGLEYSLKTKKDPSVFIKRMNVLSKGDSLLESYMNVVSVLLKYRKNSLL